MLSRRSWIAALVAWLTPKPTTTLKTYRGRRREYTITVNPAEEAAALDAMNGLIGKWNKTPTVLLVCPERFGAAPRCKPTGRAPGRSTGGVIGL